MPYSKAHKAQTRANIVAAATRAFREEGIASVAIPALMRRVGLTHGGFYAHFASKDDLVAEACSTGFVESAERLLRKIARSAPEHPVKTIIAKYLAPAHRDMPATGCMIPTLVEEIIHAPTEVRDAFTRGLTAYADLLGSYLPPTTSSAVDQPTDAALLLLGGMAGALQLARAVSDPDLSERILTTARDFYTQAFGEHSALGATEPGNIEPQ